MGSLCRWKSSAVVQKNKAQKHGSGEDSKHDAIQTKNVFFRMKNISVLIIIIIIVIIIILLIIILLRFPTSVYLSHIQIALFVRIDTGPVYDSKFYSLKASFTYATVCADWIRSIPKVNACRLVFLQQPSNYKWWFILRPCFVFIMLCFEELLFSIKKHCLEP